MNEFKVKNIFKILDDKTSLWLIGFALAVNDLEFYRGKLNDGDSQLPFSASLSVIREMAKLIGFIGSVQLKQKFSYTTRERFEYLENNLKDFSNNSLVKKHLKPIRDFTFHYSFFNYNELDDILAGMLAGLLKDLGKEKDLSVANGSSTPLLGRRYMFADHFRGHIVNKALNSNAGTVEKKNFSELNVDVDGLWDDLIKNGYMDNNGVVQGKLFAFAHHSGITLDTTYENKKKEIFDILLRFEPIGGKMGRVVVDAMGFLDSLLADLSKELFRIESVCAGPNEPCPCGSGKKYKKCCGK